MKKSLAALALALALTGALAACSTDKEPVSNAGTNSAGSNSTGASAGQVARRYDNNATIYNGRSYWNDGRYTAGTDGQVYDRTGGSMSRDLTRDARDIVRDAGDAIGDIGKGIGNAARDVTGNGRYSGTPSWEPDSSAVRY